MKSFIVLCSIMVSVNLIYSQDLTESENPKPRFSLELGPTLSKWGGDDYGGEAEYKLGYHLGVKVRFPMKNDWWVESGLSINTKGVKYSESESDSYNSTSYSYSSNYSFTEKITSTYVNFPLQFSYYLRKNISFFSGTQLSFLLNNTYKYEETECYSETFQGVTDKGCDTYKEKDSSTEGFRNVDLSIQMGINYKLNSGLNFGLNYEFGMLSIDEDSSTGPYNRQFKFSVGYDFPMSRNKP